jgi:uncharacterized protein YjaZ
MHYLAYWLVIVSLSLFTNNGIAQAPRTNHNLQIAFIHDGYAFTAEEQTYIEEIILRSEASVRDVLPNLTPHIKVSVHPLDRDLSAVGGVTGHAESPDEVVIYLSTSFEGGMANAASTGLRPVLFHEFHHLVRGWTIRDNRFGPGIAVAAVNEGLANVFAEIYTDTAFPGNAHPANADDWLREIFALPTDASYSEWMIEHPDGRQAVGYKAGSYLIRELLALTDLSILELSKLSVEQILALWERNN